MPVYAMLLAIFCTLCWGGNFSANKFAMMDFPPFLTVLLRFGTVALLTAPFALRKPLPRLRDMLIISLTLIVAHFTLIFIGMQMGLTITSVIVATQLGVPFACVASAILFKDYLGPWRSAGLMIAFLGVVIVAGTPNASQHWFGFLLALGGACGWGAANVYMKIMKPVSIVEMQFWPALFSVPMMAVLSLCFESDPWQHITHAHWQGWAAIAYSVCISSLIGYGCWSWLIGRYPLSQVVPFSLFVPIGGITAGVLIFDEPLTAQILTGAALTILGVGIITLRRPRLVEIEGD